MKGSEKHILMQSKRPIGYTQEVVFGTRMTARTLNVCLCEGVKVAWGTKRGTHGYKGEEAAGFGCTSPATGLVSAGSVDVFIRMD